MVLHRPLFLIKFEFSKVGVCGDGKTGEPGEKGLRAKKRTYHKLNPHKVLALALESIRTFFSIWLCQQLSWIIWESLRYDTNLLISHTGHQISWIKSSYELFWVCFNLEFILFSLKIQIFFDSQFSFWGIFVHISPLTKMNLPLQS